MKDEIFTSVVTIATAIVGVAILAVLVSEKAQTPKVIEAAARGFTAAIEAAVSPITGANPIQTY